MKSAHVTKAAANTPTTRLLGPQSGPDRTIALTSTTLPRSWDAAGSQKIS